MFTELTQSTITDPQWSGPLENYTHCGTAGTPGEGPYMQIWTECREEIAGGNRPPVTDNRPRVTIVRAAYKSNGCPSSMAAGAMAARVITGLTVEKALLLTGDDLLKILGGLPEGKEECAYRAIAAVRDALEK